MFRRFWTWLTDDHQVFCQPNQAKAFARCVSCGRLYPQWWANMTHQEVKDRKGRVGCFCGGLRIQPTRIRAYQSIWWMFVRGLLIRRIILGKRNWDPRITVLMRDMA